MDLLANTHTFRTIITSEIKACNLVEKDVKCCIGLVYHEYSKYAHRLSGTVTIYYKDYVPNEIGTLVCLMKLQSGWTGRLD